MTPEEPASHIPPSTVPTGEGLVGASPRRVAALPREVLERVTRREADALEAFFDHYFDPIHALACRLLGDRTAAEDLTQEVFLKVHRALATLDPGRDPWPWLATVVTNACRDVWRSGAHRMGRRSETLDAESGAAVRLATREPGPEERMLAGERERRVREAIARLPDPHRRIVWMYDFEGLSHPEVARALGIGHAAARKRYSRALEALGRLLREGPERTT